MALFINANGITQNGTSVGFGGGPLFINGNGITSPNGSALFNTPGNTAISASSGVTSSGGGKAFPTPAVGVTTSGSTSGYAGPPGQPIITNFYGNSSGLLTIQFTADSNGSAIDPSLTSLFIEEADFSPYGNYHYYGTFNSSNGLSTSYSAPTYTSTISVSTGGSNWWKVRVRVTNGIDNSIYSDFSGITNTL